jgi:nicotinamidase/pyrazinamidase
MKKCKALIIVDAQYDFMPGGALPVTEGDQIIPVINDLLPEFDLVIFTKDWHPEGMEAFASSHEGKKPFESYTNSLGETDTLWPDHCVQNTPGSDIHKDINLGLIPKDFYIFKKGMEKDKHPYSGFGAEGLREFLDEREVTDVFIVGLALDYCVKDTAIDSAMAGFNTVVIEDGTKPIDTNINQVLADFQEAGVQMIESWELEMYHLL